MAATILIVEDNPDNMRLMEYLLSSVGFELRLARNGIEGMRALRERTPDMVLLDIQMPEMDGYEMIAALRAEPRFELLPVVAVTAGAMTGDRERVIRAGFDGYIAKPLDPRSFAAEVEAFLRPDARRRHAEVAEP